MENVHGRLVRSVYFDAFRGDNAICSLTFEENEIVIPDTVTDLGKGAFIGCELLAKVTLPKGITEILSGQRMTGTLDR